MESSGVLLVFVACIICGGVSALDMTKLQPYNLTAAIMFLQEDLNQDGQMTVAEIDAVFDKYDTNGDGRESRHEYTMMICSADPDLYQISHYLYDDYDVNNDHHLEQTDYEGWHKKIDDSGDGNGVVTQEEFVNYWVKMLEGIEAQNNHPHGNSHEHGHCAAGK
ncbi:uncharacterized protein LOC132758912 [Ruditapes philippinarum]|uniref:uncharacterized protein LOC132758912 n=1 Tax=Ruditapes philippinarum TaxID=129788 RepID=UPI00295B6EB7|nr:uncharacterized protein LOC132758912 [Ruditapes philippinarum]